MPAATRCLPWSALLKDDVDAPDVDDRTTPSSPPTLGRGNGGADILGMPAVSRELSRISDNVEGRVAFKGRAPAAIVLDPGQSAALRERLLAELASITTADGSADWARGALIAKNRLTAADGKLVEVAFEQRVSELSEPTATEQPLDPGIDPAQMVATAQTVAIADVAEGHRSKGIDKSALAVSEPRRYRNREHLRFVAQQACLVCGRKPSDPHHLRFTQPRALSRKVSDEFAVPLCRGHHRAVHRSGNEQEWWQQAGIEPIKVARKLWRKTRGTREPPREPGAAIVLEQNVASHVNPSIEQPMPKDDRRNEPIQGA
jgi:hypothetical protein